MDTNEEKARKLAISYTKGINENGVEVYDVRCEGALQEMAEWKDGIMKELIHKMKEYLIVEQGFDYDSSSMEHFEDFIGVEHELYNPFETEDE